MKKFILLASVVATGLFTSCSSEHKCVCDFGDGAESVTIYETTKSKAKALCEGKGVTIQNENGEEEPVANAFFELCELD